MNRNFTFALILSLGIGVGVGCGSAPPSAPTTPTAPSAAAPSAPTAPASPTAATPATGPSPDSANPSAPPAVWSADMPKNDQVTFMKQNIVPKMGPDFTSHDAAKYGNFGCKTCHGPKLSAPKDFLPHLTFKDGKITSFADKPEISKWMMEKVSPDMASAMGLPHFDPKTGKGFGCGGCHTIDMKLEKPAFFADSGAISPRERAHVLSYAARVSHGDFACSRRKPSGFSCRSG